MLRKFRSLGYGAEENYIRDATSNSPGEPPQQLLLLVGDSMRKASGDTYTKMISMLTKRLTDFPKIAHVYKSLILIEYGLTNFPDEFVQDVETQISVIQRICKYRYYKDGKTDIAGSVRTKAAQILVSLAQEEDLKKKRVQTAEKQSKAPTTSSDTIVSPEAVKAKTEEEEKAEDTANKEEIAAVQFDAFSDGSIIIKGRVGANAGRINGIFHVRTENVGGVESFEREGKLDDPIVFWYHEKLGLWMISRESAIGTDGAYACCQAKVETPLKIPEGANWKCFDTTESKYVDEKNIVIEKFEGF